MKWRLVFCLVMLSPNYAAFAQAPKPTVFVGPQIRDGLLDTDSGIRDSIQDIKQQLQGTSLMLTPSREEATLTLIVIARGIVTNGSVGFASSALGFGMVVPNAVPTLTTLLKVGSYQRIFQSEGGTWTKAADTVVKDLMAWWDANRDVVLSRVGA
jgi:hypothetical protein